MSSNKLLPSENSFCICLVYIFYILIKMYFFYVESGMGNPYKKNESQSFYFSARQSAKPGYSDMCGELREHTMCLPEQGFLLILSWWLWT